MVKVNLGSLILNVLFSNSEIEPKLVSNSTTLTFDYSCPSSTSCGFFNFVLPKGVFLLQVWGAQGGRGSYSENPPGGKGGYSRGVLTLANDVNINVYVGGSGTTGGLGGFNGGGSVSASIDLGGSGGGSSDIRLVSNSIYHRVIVGGGGGGTEFTNMPGEGWGGGIVGSHGLGDEISHGGQGGSQTYPGVSGGSDGLDGGFWYGGSVSNFHQGGGGGGWYGGGGGGIDGDGGGGSGFVYNSETQSYVPSGYQLGSDFFLSNSETISGNISFPSPFSPHISEIGHSGDGAASITILSCQVGNFIPSYDPHCYADINIYLLSLLFLLGSF